MKRTKLSTFTHIPAAVLLAFSVTACSSGGGSEAAPETDGEQQEEAAAGTDEKDFADVDDNSSDDDDENENSSNKEDDDSDSGFDEGEKKDDDKDADDTKKDDDDDSDDSKKDDDNKVVVPAPIEVTVYFDSPDSSASIYAWVGEDDDFREITAKWPGDSMTKASNVCSSCYSFTFQEGDFLNGEANLIFNWDGDKGKTQEHVLYDTDEDVKVVASSLKVKIPHGSEEMKVWAWSEAGNFFDVEWDDRPKVSYVEGDEYAYFGFSKKLDDKTNDYNFSSAISHVKFTWEIDGGVIESSEAPYQGHNTAYDILPIYMKSQTDNAQIWAWKDQAGDYFSIDWDNRPAMTATGNPEHDGKEHMYFIAHPGQLADHVTHLKFTWNKGDETLESDGLKIAEHMTDDGAFWFKAQSENPIDWDGSFAWEPSIVASSGTAAGGDLAIGSTYIDTYKAKHEFGTAFTMSVSDPANFEITSEGSLTFKGCNPCNSTYTVEVYAESPETDEATAHKLDYGITLTITDAPVVVQPDPDTNPDPDPDTTNPDQGNTDNQPTM